MSFCAQCRSLQATVFGEAVQNVTYNLQRYPHLPNYTALVKSAGAGCGLCKILLHALLDDEQLKSNAEIKLDHNGQPVFPDGALGLGGMLCIDGKRSIWMDGLVGALGQVRAYEIPSGWWDPWAEEDIDVNDRAVGVISYWIKTCLAEHPECWQSRPVDFIPTRVIAVGGEGDDHVQLIQAKEREPADKRYVALSHCWGLNMPPSATTVEAVLSDHLRSISLNNLTATFIDAIKITRRLGISYIWIDSLCIVQDSAADWDAEASEMAAVYSSAYVTLAASGSADGTQGCRTQRDQVPYIDVPINGGELEPESMTQRRYRVCAWPNFSDYHINRDPLHSRGWCLQERELSPRIAHFSSDTVRWECRKTHASLVFPWLNTNAFLGYPRIFDYDDSGRRHPKLNPTLGGDMTGDGLLQAASEWLRLVRMYSAKNLTKQTDMLPAIGGLARAYAKFTPGEYHAGHFASHGIVNLLWRVDDPHKTEEEPRRPQEYTAPSWSWASIARPVAWDWNLFMDKDRIKSVADIMVMDTSPLGLDPFGRVKSGMVRIKG
ncbi:heterokaryon incompatibility protein-domain-containing protein [Pseudomassariella vexata]|uniref:Heterokaryon incompatibility protein-domain-containing protein n=1 Tax=Pseudomassariella vexata TaxID=1141098 RepID=A0A1Y2EDH0_9PEZI|nr:heterokaryon incompatibility protein-domain-containing protein [Pseudomassariella vexata]ORY68855.1 heterokaryon incompatibility protein-domain-containing protein [Pseudomassariella vexata]